jgi:hypothetical protein
VKGEISNRRYYYPVAVITALVVGIGSIAIPIDSADAVQRNNLAASNRAGDNTQEGLVNVGNVQANVQVGANVCALAENC